ncbi:hypothetical protein FOCC_FOCC015929, partial [Frankliniella occidentalis]
MGTEGYEDKEKLLEQFVLVMYDSRLQLFTNGRQMDNIPPTEDALQLHGRRAAFQGGFIWAQSLQKQPNVPSPADWGWTKTDNGWQPVWISLPTAAATCKELKSCRCKSKCTVSRCSCLQQSLKCTLHCKNC